MAEIRPFKAVRYNPNKVRGIHVTAPPYDVISPTHREELYAKSPFNIVRIDYGKDEPGDNGVNRYTRAREFLHKWLNEGVLIRDPEECIYLYEIDYQVNNTAQRLSGILLLLKLEELGKGVFPHEATHLRPKADRLNLMKACLANTSPIFALYRGDAIAPPAKGLPVFESTDSEGYIHRLYKHSEEGYISSLIRELRDRAIFIADGHHRYEVALEFKRLADSGQIEGLPNYSNFRPWDYVLTLLVEINSSDLTVLPTHRLVRSIPGGDSVLSLLSRHFEVTDVRYTGHEQDIIKTLREAGKNTIGLYMGGELWHILKYKHNALQSLPAELRRVDTVILQELILKEDLRTEDIVYEMDIKRAISLMGNGAFKALFILNPTEVMEIEGVAMANLRMPPKSTYFYPKLLTGMAIYTFF